MDQCVIAPLLVDLGSEMGDLASLWSCGCLVLSCHGVVHLRLVPYPPNPLHGDACT
jgi:hypothetical protein